MAGRRENVVRVMLWLADDLDARRYGMAGVLRQLAREVAQLEDDGGAGGCPCGARIEQLSTGRPRKFCLACSPRRKRPEKGIVGSNADPGERNVA